MSNWEYARETPTKEWRSAMTLPRKLSLRQIDDKYHLINYPIESFETMFKSEFNKNLVIKNDTPHNLTFDHFNESEIRFRTALRDFELRFMNEVGDTLRLTMDSAAEEFVLDRRQSGKVDFKEEFAPDVQRMPIDNLPEDPFEVLILLDWSSVEIFINDGQYVMTAQIFPNEFYQELQVDNKGDNDLILLNFEVSGAESIW